MSDASTHDRSEHSIDVTEQSWPIEHIQDTQCQPRIDVEDRPAARQKRKRTSPDDQAILEDAFNRDSKPDKAARLDIVQRVALSEKEVQIWFQNRRQTSRRKSRPLMMHEVMQYQLARSNSSTELLPPSSSPNDQPPSSSQFEPSQGFDSNHVEIHEPQPSPSGLKSGHEIPDSSPVQFAPSSSAPAQLVEQTSIQESRTEGRPSSVGYLANRRSAPSLRKSFSHHESNPSVLLPNIMPSPRRLTKSKSMVRLSMTADGSAEIKAAASPSPPRPLPTPPSSYPGPTIPSPAFTSTPSLKPTSPNLAFPSSHPSTTTTKSTLHRTSSGRSRDSRSWEFWCDKDSRNALPLAAEKEISGSATGALGLVRSAAAATAKAVSGRRSALMPVTGNAGNVSRESASGSGGTALGRKRAGEEVGKGKEKRVATVTRALTAGGRLQGVAGGGRKRVVGRDEGKGGVGIGDDKENIDPELDPELAAFMGSARERGSSAGEEELDCVQGLLSLSQGQWRR